ncbi:hypothetical protein PG993_015197 [Apiospora rasikravindrae]|uniref:Heterokaryon incompatibility domain-containing protein n=1 Tax=Apiospora rasikravindrae TaxID=990691 RepID=A0ABR1RPW8_9PEZI
MPSQHGYHRRSSMDSGEISEPGLQDYYSEELEGIDEYEYRRLQPGKKRIRLIKLKTGHTDNREIVCEFYEAEYDTTFHIPRRIAHDHETAAPSKKSGDEDARPTPVPEDHQDGRGVDSDDVKIEKLRKLKEERRAKQQRSIQQREKDEVEYAEEEMKRFEEARKNRVKYEALSWCWGSDEPRFALKIEEGDNTYKFKVKRELALALKYLRRKDRVRWLWIDAICINQADPEERNHQVQMMSRIYTRAERVCVWLGEHTEDSKMAIEFIRNEVMELDNFDKICTDQKYTRKWQALQMLMQTEWFSRRWVVQEIALAKKATVYCGNDSMPWKDFAIAVELFVEVETATHRLSEIMQNDEKFRHVPGWFEHVSELGASLLVQATGKVFRGPASPLHELEGDETDSEDESSQEFLRWSKIRTIDPLERRSLLSLEYLVSTMFIFKAAEPRDVIYSLLAIARDAAPFAGVTSDEDDPTFLTMTLFDQFLEEKPFLIDYSRPYSDVCRDFVRFVIRRKKRRLPEDLYPVPEDGPEDWTRLKRWCTEYKEETKASVEKRREEKAKKLEEEKLKGERPKDKRPNPGRSKTKRSKHKSPDKSDDSQNDRDLKDVELPSWVARASRAPFSLDNHPGMRVKRMGRANADPLVGQPTDGHRNYSAAQTRHVNLEVLKFRKRPDLGHYSMYVQGFQLDEVVQVVDASQGGSIPTSWLRLGGWEWPYEDDPPDELWRTLVADRGRDNRNPPYYYARACRESVHKGNTNSGRVKTGALINNERNSIVTEFCRRVHAVIWNRRMFKTEKGRLGLAYDVEVGDKVCVLYGCTVPVVLKQKDKKRPDPTKNDEGDLARERLEDAKEALKACIRQCEKNRQRKKQRKSRNEEKKKLWIKTGEWYEMMEAKEQAESQLKREKGIEGEEIKAEDGKAKDGKAKDGKAKDGKAEDGKAEEGTSEEGRTGEEAGEEAGEEIYEEANDGTNNSGVGEGIDHETEERAAKKINEAKEKEKGEEKDTPDDSATVHPPDHETPKTSFQKKIDDAKRDDPYLFYILRGDCYLHGMMDGEAVRHKFYEEIPDRVFELR